MSQLSQIRWEVYSRNHQNKNLYVCAVDKKATLSCLLAHVKVL